jgi:fructose-specific phosphotransferase system IIA component
MKLKFSDFIQTENIIVNLSGLNKLDVIKELLDRMQKNGDVTDYKTALNDILIRENHLSTGLENGIAIPHAKTDGVEKLAVIFGIKKDGVEFESLDAKPANIFFLVLSPKNTSGPHIQALAMISRNLSINTNRKKLLEAKSVQEIVKIFSSFN